MKLQFKHQPFQAEAAAAVCDVFNGQPYRTVTYRRDLGDTAGQQLSMEDSEVGFRNQPFIPEVTNRRILDNLRAVQRRNGLRPSDELTGPGVNLSIEMETGTGKTYTYVKTMYELNKRYGWSKYIIVVPSVAIREGVYKSLQTTQEHFAEEYGRKIRFFIYSSDNLPAVDTFASDSAINVMIINMQAFNSSKNQRIIDKKLDTFRSRKPIDIIAKTNPILIIDEPQSVEGKQTKESLKKFCPLFTLRYSATHKEKYDMVYRLDAMDAYNQHLVKKIAALGVTLQGSTATTSYVYLEGIDLYKDKSPTARLGFEVKGKIGTRTVVRKVSGGDDLYDLSDGLDEYADRFKILPDGIDGRDNSVTFLNGLKLYAGQISGSEVKVAPELATAIYEDLVSNGYVKRGELTDKYYADKASGTVQVAEEVKDCTAAVVQVLSSIYDSHSMRPEDAHGNNVEARVDPEKLHKKEFVELWNRINHKSFYTVRFDKEKLIESAVKMLDEKLNVTTVTVKLEYGEQAARLDSKEQLEQGHGFHRTLSDQEAPKTAPLGSVRYDLIGKLVEETKLTRATIAAILQRMAPQKFAMFRLNPEEFILKTAKIINDQMATQIIEHITYNKLDAAYDTDIFTSANLRGKLGLNAMEANRSLYSHIIYDSENEKRFAGELDVNAKVAVYVKLPGGFFISTPVGKYNPDWAIAFNEGSVKHIYFIAETKGNSDAAELRGVENAKIACAKAHFAAISSESVTYSVVDSFAELMNIVS